MIKNISLTFNSFEMEHAYRKWIFQKYQHRQELLICLIIIYLVIMIINFNNHSNILPLIVSCISLSIQLTMLFFLRKYAEKSEIFITSNQIILALICETFRLFANEEDQWYVGFGLASIKLIIYIQGNKFVFQSGIQALSLSSSLFYMETQDANLIATHLLILFFLICCRYQIEFTNRNYFMASQSQEQYENVVQDLLPSWVIIVKYDKVQGQLSIDKINKNMQEKLDIDCDRTFRDFLRKLKVLPYDIDQQSYQYIKLEHTLIRLLQLKNDDHSVERYHGFIEKKDSKTKQWKFKITQVYFKTFEPSVILLFEELKEDKYESLLLQIEQRDNCSFANSKLAISLITQQLQLLKYIKQQLPVLFNGKQQYLPNQILQHLSQQISLGYVLFNLNYNMLNLYKISHRQLKFKVSPIKISEFLETFCGDLQLQLKRISRNLLNNEYIEMIQTDRAKLISILVNLIEFIKIILSIVYGDAKMMTQAHPLDRKIEISLKQSKIYPKCCKITLTHPKFSIPAYIIDLLGNIESVIDHKKRNWGSKNYFDMINQLNQTFQSMFEYYKKENKSTSMMEDDLLTFQHIQKQNINFSSDSKINIIHNSQPHYQFNTLGYPLAQYQISQLGPCNKVFFQNRHANYVGTPTKLYGQSSTKIFFLIYQDLNEFIQELNQSDNQVLETFIKKKSHEHDTSQRFYLSQLASSPRRFL